MKKSRQHVFMEHYLVPAGLFILNICLIHLIYVMETGIHYTGCHKGMLGLNLLLLLAGLITKNRMLLLFPMTGYLLVLLWPWL